MSFFNDGIINEPVNQDEVDHMEGVYNRQENYFRVQMINIEHRVKNNYANEILLQKREGSKLTYGR